MYQSTWSRVSGRAAGSGQRDGLIDFEGQESGGGGRLVAAQPLYSPDSPVLQSGKSM